MAAKKDFVVKNGLVVGTTADSATPGQLSWNPDFETINLNLDAAVTARLAQDQYVYARAATTVAKGSPVYVSGAIGNSGKVEVTPFIANSTIEERRFIGVAAESLTTGQFGFIATFGEITGVSTDGSALTTPETWNDGTILYASPNVAGEFTSVEPEAPNQTLPVAFVVNASASDGILFIRASDIGRHLDELHDVYVNSIADNQLLVWDSANSRWNNESVTTTIIGEGSNLYYTKARVDSDVQQGITALIDGAPAALDTLNELAAALNDDASFAATVTGLITALPDSAEVSAIITADVDKAFVDALNVDADTLDSQDGSYYLDYTNFTNTPNVLDSADVLAIAEPTALALAIALG